MENLISESGPLSPESLAFAVSGAGVEEITKNSFHDDTNDESTMEDVVDTASESSPTAPPTSVLLSEILRYSVDNKASLERGGLWLSHEEAEKLTKVIASLNLSESWHFREDLPTVFHPQPQKVLKAEGTVKGRSKTGAKKKKRASTPSSIPSGKKDSKDSTVKATTRNQETDRMSVAQRVARSSQGQLKRLPDWGRRLHRVVLLLSQTEACKPFVVELSVNHPKYGEICDAVQPVLCPMGLWTVISKLEQGGYQTALEVFNDIYSIWLCSYRSNPPGSPLWLQTHQASRSFFQQIANHPLRDDFGLPPSPSDAISDEPIQSSVEHGNRQQQPIAGGRQRRCSANVDELLQEFLTLQDGTSPPPAAGKQTRRLLPATSKAAPAKRKSGAKSTATVVHEPITEAERETFQSYLSQLQAKHHLMLFDAFRRAAVWRTLEGAGAEVELDDAKTTPYVFRKMVAWCRSQLAVGQPSEKRRKLDVPSGQSQDTVMTSSGQHPPAPTAESGSGKFVPSLYDMSTGGKLAAGAVARHIQSMDNPADITNSQVASSSSSPSSSEDASDSSESESSGPLDVVHNQAMMNYHKNFTSPFMP